MNTYLKYKQTDQLWLSSIPSHWDSKKIKHLFSERVEKGYPDEPLLVSSQNMGVVPKNVYGNRTVEAQKDLHLLKLVRKGDFVISLRAFQGGIEYAYYQGIISPAYTIMISNGEMDSSYFKYLAKSARFIELLRLCVTGIREGQNIDYQRLKNYKIPVPPRDEQEQIVRFLDWKVSAINRLIANYQGRIKTLEMLTQRIINDYLIFGCNKNQTWQKISDVTTSRWMPKIPSHWELSQIGKHFIIKKRIAGREGFPVLSITQQGLKEKNIASNEGQMANDYSGYQFVYPGDYAMNHMDLLTGYIGISSQLGVTSPDYRVFSLEDTIHCYADYYLLLFQLCYKRRIFYAHGRGAAAKGRWRLPAENFRRFTIPLPPIEEQKEIVTKIKPIQLKLEKLIQGIEQKISVLCELRARLISDVVTGKIDVRGVEVPEYETVEKDTVEDSEIQPSP